MQATDRRAAFLTPDVTHRPMYYFPFPSIGTDADTLTALEREVDTCRRCGCSTLIPTLPADTMLTAEQLIALKKMYLTLLSAAARQQLAVGFYLDPAFERATIRAMDEIGDHTLRARILNRKEYVCERGTPLQRRLSNGERLSLVAYSEDTSEAIDLRPFVTDGVLSWQVPNGNYIVCEYLCATDPKRYNVNYLSYDASLTFLHTLFSFFADTFAPFLGTTLTTLVFSDIGFVGQNRRDWDFSFNEIFAQRFGFDPAPYYPALFGYIGPETDSMKAYFMTVRASLLQNGILRALQDVAAEHNLTLFGTLCEPKLTACSFTMGDAMLSNQAAPCALFDKAYMYGTNSVKIAAGAAYNFDIERVNAELFRHYTKSDPERLYKDALNAFARGVNCTALHLPPELTANSDFCDFVARVQSMLRGGSHVADIAMLYPIYHLHSKSGLYFSDTQDYEYPSTPSTADYMTLINSISIYSGHDLTVLHPETLQNRCRTEGGVLYLENERNRETFRVVVLPGTSMISLANLQPLKAFYDGGGKILATGVLPTHAFEADTTGDNDKEVCRLIREMFGEDACNPLIMRDYCHHVNAAGGEALFLYFNASASDGTRMTRSSTVNEALNSFGIPFDIYLPGMPRPEITGALNAAFPEFRAIGLHRTMPGDGMLNHIHKHHEDCDIYYFSNTTKEAYNHHVLLRGAFSVEEWDPYTGHIVSRNSKLLSYKGEIYTNLRLTLQACSSTFFVTKPLKTVPDGIEIIRSIHRLQSEQAMLMSEF